MSGDSALTTDRYFAAVGPADIGRAVFGRLSRVAETRRGGERHECQLEAYNAYYGWDTGSGVTWRVDRDGEVGELTSIRINRARTALRSLIGLLTQAPYSWRPKARNGGASPRSAVLLASNLLEHYWDNQGWQARCVAWAEGAGVASEAYQVLLWNEEKGKAAGLEYQQPDPNAGPAPEGAPAPAAAPMPKAEVREGGVEPHLLFPWDVFRDEDVRNADDGQWICVRIVHPNKWDLVDQYPKDINGAETASTIKSAQVDAGLPLPESRQLSGVNSEAIAVYHFFHKKTRLVPNGRHTILISNTCVLRDGDLDYPDVPVVRLALEEQLDTPWGYSSWWDTLGAQQLADGLQTSIASNQAALATQSIAMEEGTRSDIDSVSGLKAFYFPRGATLPQPLQLTATPKEVFEHLGELYGHQTDMVGLNDVVQGQPDTAQMNAQAFALLASMAVQRNGPSQKAFLNGVAKLGQMLLAILRDKVSTKRQTAIAGKQATESVLRDVEWEGADLDPIEATPVTIGNPLEQTQAGRYQLLQLYMALPGVVKDPVDIQQVVETGRLEQALESPRMQELAIAAENEMLQDGGQPPVLWTDDHPMHARKHRAVMDYADVRTNKDLAAAVKTHLDWHYREYWGLPEGQPPEMDPQYPVRMRLLLGQQPPPEAPGPMPGPPPNGPPPPGAKPPPNGPPKPGTPHPLPPAVSSAAPPGLPKSPTNGEPPVAPPPGVPHAA